MSDSSGTTELQADDRIVLAVARAMCGSRTPCSYHVRLAHVAIPAYKEAAGIITVAHEGVVR